MASVRVLSVSPDENNTTNTHLSANGGTPVNINNDTFVADPNQKEIKIQRDELDAVVRKVLRRILPIAMLGLFAAYIDRTNLSVVGSDMAKDLQLTPSMFGLASGLFFIGYVLFEVPSNVALQRFGARLWLARIMVSWGLVCMATSLVTGALSLYLLRFLLGAGEAGFYPGIIFFLGLFTPVAYLARAYAIFQISVPFSLALGSLVTSALLYMDGIGGLRGWQWVMILEGAFAILMGIITFMTLSDLPEKSSWLTPREKLVLKSALRAERREEDHDAHGLRAIGQVLKSRHAWYYALNYMFMLIGFYAVIYWLPQIIKLRFNVSTVQAGLLSAVPWLYVTIVLIFVARNMVGVQGATPQRRARQIAIYMSLSAVGLLIAVVSSNAYLSFVGLCLAASIQACVPMLYTFPSEHFGRGARSAAVLAMVNSIGNIGGFFGPYIVGLAREWSGNDNAGMLVLAGSFAIAAVMAIGLPRQLAQSGRS